MKLYTFCPHCKKETTIKSMASTRSDLEREKGEVFNLQCTTCHKNSEIRVNDVKAKANSTLLIGGLMVTVVVTLVLWNILGLMSTITAIIPILIARQQNQTVHTFNSYRI